MESRAGETETRHVRGRPVPALTGMAVDCGVRGGSLGGRGAGCSGQAGAPAGVLPLPPNVPPLSLQGFLYDLDKVSV